MTQNASGMIPVEFNVIVELDAQEEKTKGGIILPTAAKDRDELAAEEGTLIAVSPLAFNYVDEWPEGTKPQIGQRVMFKRYDGLLRKRTVKGVERSFRLLVDKSIVAIVEPDRDEGFAAVQDNLVKIGAMAAAGEAY